MKKEVLELIRQNLEKQKKELLEGADEVIGGGLASKIEDLSDPGDQALIESNHNFIIRLREREKKLLNKIEETLNRIDSGTFGICEKCGQDIGEKRLFIRPVTTLCIDCKTEEEEEEEKINK